MKKPNYFIILFIIIFIIGFLPIIVLGVYSYSKSFSVVHDKVEKMNEDYVSHVKLSVEERLRFAQNYYTIVAISDSLIDWTNKDIDFKDYVQMKALQKSLNGGSVLDELIENVYFINAEKDYFISQKGVGIFSQKPDSEKVMNILNKNKDIKWFYIEKNEYDNTGKFTEIQGMCLVFNIPLNNNNSKNWLVVSLSGYQFNKFMYRLDNHLNMIITDENNIVIFHRDEDKIGSQYEQNDKELKFTKITSEYNGWTYYTTYSETETYKELKPIGYMVFTICAILLAVVILFGFLGSKIMYSPIRNIYDATKSFISSEEGATTNEQFEEFMIINKGLNNLMNKTTEMELKLDYAKHQLSDMFFNEMLRGYLTESEIHSRVVFLNLNEKYKYMCILVVQVSRNENEIEESNLDLQTFRFKNTLHTMLDKEQLFSIVVIKDKIVIMLGGDKDIEDFMDYIYSIAEKILKSGQELIKNKLIIGISTTFSDFTDIKERYLEALNALLFKSPDKNSNIFIFYNSNYLHKQMKQYPKQKIRELVCAIRSKEKEESERLTEEIIESFYMESREYSQYQVDLTHFAMDIFTMLEEFLENYEEIMPKYMALNKEIEQNLYNSIDTKKCFMELLILPIISILENYNGSSQDDILNKVLDIIHSEYTTNITIEECANRLNYHPTYIWKIMRSNLNTNFSDYLSDYRHTMAKKMLLETSMTVAEIAERLCYHNSQNFIRSFKKRENITPGKYRENKPVHLG